MADENKNGGKYVRPTWDEYFMEVCRTVAKRATCDRGRSG
ncbi:MAG TPA: cell division protein DedD, partial [Treponema sp.]|nr:cell division protein DedD [Treponema sp.]